MKTSVVKNLPKPSSESIVVFAIEKDSKKVFRPIGPAIKLLSQEQLDFEKVGAGKSENLYRFTVAGQLFGAISGTKNMTTDELRNLAGSVARQTLDIKELILVLPTSNEQDTLAVLEGASLANYEFQHFKSSAQTKKLASVTAVSNYEPSIREKAKIAAITKHVNQVRDLVNSPANELYPSKFAEITKLHAKGLDVKVAVWDEKKLAAEKCGGILAVGQGSAKPPRLVKITYSPKGKSVKHLALVGKGITFDTGGLSLKPAGSMGGMKYDMTGAATVLNAVQAIAALKLNIKVTAWACIAENMPSGAATRPNDVVKARNGKSIEVMNTDAEGRVVLADGLSLASEEMPDLIVDVATLTGAATVALGRRYAGLMGDEKSTSIVSAAAKDAGELVWPMPLPGELRSVLDSPIADIANAKLGNTDGGMLIGGLFLQEFVGVDKSGKKLPWAHLDIAGPANNDREPWGFTGKGATGAILRTLVALAERMATAK